MQILRSKIVHHFKPYLIAVIIALQIQSIYVAFDLNRSLEEKTASYLDEAAVLASTVLEQRIVSVVESLSSLARDTDRALASAGGTKAAAELLHAYKTKWGYSDLYLLTADGAPLVEPTHHDPAETALARSAVLHGEPVLGKCLVHDAVAYAIPVERENRTHAVLMGSRTAQKAYELLDIGIFKGKGLAMLLDYDGNVLVKRWNGERDQLVPEENFLTYEGRLDTDVLGPDYSLHRNGHSSFYDGQNREWLLTQRYLEDFGLTVLFTAPAELLLEGLPALRSQNMAMHLISFLLMLLLIADLIWLSRAYQRQVETTATTDPLTLGPNAASFAEKAKKLVQSGQTAIVSMDINKFKVINDEYGVDKANEFLCMMYEVLESHILADELCARYNADTFLMLLQWNGEERLRERLSMMINELMERKHRLGLWHKQGLSAGVYVVESASLPVLLMIDHANLARQLGKKRPGQTVTFFDESVARLIRRDSDLINTFASSLYNGDFHILLQPKVNIRLDRVCGAEALVRWKHPELGMLSPAVFLPVLEESGHIIELDLWVFEQVCALLSRWQNEGRDVLPVSVNLSRAHLKNEYFLNHYLNIIQSYGVDPQKLELELTESVFMEDEREIPETFASIRSHGLRCAIDDFGTGYSSLSMLKNAHVDTVKLDRTFFSGAGLSEQSKSVIRSITQLASALGLECVAEGVENREVIEFLVSTECHVVQGYVYSKPLSVADFEAYAFSGDGQRRLLGSGVFEHARRAMLSRHEGHSRQMRDMLNGLGSVGVYVVKRSSRELLFCNDFLKSFSPMAQEGVFCNDVWGEYCSDHCPLRSLNDGGPVCTLADTSVFGRPVQVCASEIMWDERTPAYLISLVPFGLREEEEEEVVRLRAQAAAWRRKAQEDDLTKLLSRTLFTAEVSRRLASDQSGVLLFIDLDGFKQINDVYGHQMGDEVLKNCSQRIRLTFRSDDLIGRYGGDEFLVYASGFSSDEVLEQRLRTLGNLMRHPHTLGDVSCTISASIGVARFPNDATDYKDLEARADLALYKAKHRGKNRHVYYEKAD